MTTRARLAILALTLGMSRTAHAQLAGMQFCVDTIEVPRTVRSPLAPVAGRVSVADRRGRIDIEAVRRGPTTVVNGALVAAPAWRPGDYYLFNDTALVLVRPSTKTYSLLPLTQVTSNTSLALLSSDILTSFIALHIDTVRGTRTRAMKRLAYALQMHVDVRGDADQTRSLARARVSVADAPVGEVSILRWVGAARILQDIGSTVRLKPSESLQLTTAVILEPGAGGGARALIGLGQPITCLRTLKISESRLALPPGYKRTPWPSGRASR